VPERVYGGWQVAAVPGSLTALLVVSTLVCLLVATVVTVRDGGIEPRTPSGLAWLAIVLVSAGALVFNALVLAADASEVVGAIIPIFHWAFTLVPALLAGAVTYRREAAAAGTAALGTGLVTLPLFALGWALLYSVEPGIGAIGSTLWITAILGAIPLLIGVATAGGWGRRHEWRATAGNNFLR
jgi:hypothetical protein